MMITLHFKDGEAYVWNDKDWYELRTRHRICGTLIGTVASFPRQNDFSGLPMKLMPEEAAMLIENGVCELVENVDINKMRGQDEKDAADKLFQILMDEQSELLKKKRIEQLAQKMDLIVAGKKKKLIAKGEAITEESLGKDALLQEQIEKLPPLASSYLLLQIPTEDPFPVVKMKKGIEHLTKLDMVRLAVFKDLWKRGHYITNGSSFGGDFLVYPGEPVRFHAMFIVRCVASEHTSIRPMHLIAFGRLSVSVNKRSAIATVSDDGEVIYQTIQWHETIVD